MVGNYFFANQLVTVLEWRQESRANFQVLVFTLEA